MATFQYKAVDAKGKTVTGKMDDQSKQGVINNLKKINLTPISVTETKGSANNTTRPKANNNKEQGFFEKLNNMNLSDLGEIDVIPQKITPKDYAVFCRQAYTMLHAGMSIIATLQILAVQVENKRLRKTVGFVVTDLQKGYPLSTCLRMHPKVFPPLFINMIESGELTGNLDGVLNSLSKQYDRDHEINSQVQKATVYPKVVGVVAIGVVMALLIFVVPTFVTMFNDSGTPLPLITVNLIAMSDFVQAKWAFIIVVFVILYFAMEEVKKHDKSKYYYDLIIFKLPVIGKATVKISTARFARTASTLLESGIPIIAAIKSAAQVSGNMVVIRGIDSIADEIRAGKPLNMMLASLNYFPPMMVSMVSIGEESGDIVGLLDKTADYYEDEMKEAIDTLTGLIEPVMIVFLAVVVGYVVMAILLPVLDSANAVKV